MKTHTWTTWERIRWVLRNAIIGIPWRYSWARRHVHCTRWRALTLAWIFTSMLIRLPPPPPLEWFGKDGGA